ncbi:MAG: ABC transporter ATP-binding protein [Thermodesulfobacteria bacterium]|nr:ABC transporter ATP-binding protein [Thermodesulfobacteriota bacterium]
MLRVEGLEVSYGHIKALKGVSLEVPEGKLFVLLGRNGAGKSTLLLSLVGLIKPAAGRIFLNGEEISKLPPWQRVKRGLVLVPEGRRIFPSLTVKENLELGAFSAPKGAASRLEEVLEIFPALKERLLFPAGALSGGEQQMLALARALMSNPKVMLLDEPSMGLAPKVVGEIYRILEKLKGGLTIFLVEQNVNRALSLADRVLLLESGRLSASWHREEVDLKLLEAAYLGEEK